jgi:hypothetical protein
MTQSGYSKASRRTSASKPTSLRDLAESLQLSPATVSVVMNDAPGAKAIPAHTKERIRKAARNLHYRPNFFARSLSLKRGFTVGVLVPEISEGYAASIMSGIEDDLLREGYFYFVASHRGQPDLIAQYPRMLIDVSISGHRRVRGVTNITVDHRKGNFRCAPTSHRLGSSPDRIF